MHVNDGHTGQVDDVGEENPSQAALRMPVHCRFVQNYIFLHFQVSFLSSSTDDHCKWIQEAGFRKALQNANEDVDTGAKILVN